MIRAASALMLLGALLPGCDPYAGWPDPASVFPYVYTKQPDLEEHEKIRWETETWSQDDLGKAGLYLKKMLLGRASAPTEELEHFKLMRPRLPALTGAGVRLSLVGDVMWVGGNWTAFATPSAGLLDGALRAGNLETPTSQDHPTGERELGTYSFNAPPAMLNGLPLDLLQLTNNHSLDAGDLGLENTVKEVEKRGLKHTGVDRQLQLTVGGLKVAFLAYTWGINDKKRSKKGHELHIIPFGHQSHAIDLSPLEGQAAAARSAGADLVVAMLHWGYEYEHYPDPHFMVLARRVIAAGADLVVGHGPHVAQPAELCHVNRPEHAPGVGACSLRTADGRARTAAVLYSLGDFGTTLPTVPTRSGLVATVELDRGGVAGLGWAAVYCQDITGQKGKRVVPLAGLTAGSSVMSEEMKRLEGLLGAGWKR